MAHHPLKRYIGDGVYVDYDGNLGLVLTTEDGVNVTNRIVLEPMVYEALDAYVRSFLVDDEDEKEDTDEVT